MTEKQWYQLQPGWIIVNKRAPGIQLVVSHVGCITKDTAGHTISGIKVVAPQGPFFIPVKRYQEFTLKLKQEALPL